MIGEGTSIPHLLNLENTAQAVISGDWNTFADGVSVRPGARGPPVRSILRILGRPMEGAERYPLRSRQSWQAAPPRPRQPTMILLYAASRDPRRGETPVMRASAVPAAALAWGSSVEYRQQRKSKKAAPQGAVPPRYGAAFSALRQKYGDRPPPLFSRQRVEQNASFAKLGNNI